MPTDAQRAAARERQRRYRETHREQRIAEMRAYRAANPDRDREYYLANREKIIERSMLRHAARRDEILENNRVRYAANRAAVRAKQAAARALDPEKDRARSRAYLAANREDVNARRRAKRAANPHHFQCLQGARRARHFGVTGTFTREDWCALLTFFRNACAYCGAVSALEQEHVVPLQRPEHSPMHDATNILPSCRSCNRSKRNRLVSEWRSEIVPALIARVEAWNPALAANIAA